MIWWRELTHRWSAQHVKRHEKEKYRRAKTRTAKVPMHTTIARWRIWAASIAPSLQGRRDSVVVRSTRIHHHAQSPHRPISQCCLYLLHLGTESQKLYTSPWAHNWTPGICRRGCPMPPSAAFSAYFVRAAQHWSDQLTTAVRAGGRRKPPKRCVRMRLKIPARMPSTRRTSLPPPTHLAQVSRILAAAPGDIGNQSKANPSPSRSVWSSRSPGHDLARRCGQRA